MGQGAFNRARESKQKLTEAIERAESKSEAKRLAALLEDKQKAELVEKQRAADKKIVADRAVLVEKQRAELADKQRLALADKQRVELADKQRVALINQKINNRG